MNKREFLHTIIDRLMDIEENSNKVCFLRYSGHIESVSVDVASNKEAYSSSLFKDFFISPSQESLTKLSEELEKVSKIQDGPVEKMISLQIPLTQAKELGLLKETV